MGCGCEILSQGCKLWMELNDSLSYFVTISLHAYIQTTIGVPQSQSILT